MLKFPLFITLLAFFSCNHQVYSPLTYKGRMLEWGTGGGFTGAVKSFCILDNGHYFKSEDGGESYVEAGKLAKDQARVFFNNYDQLGLAAIQLNEPGNKYYFIVEKGHSNPHKLLWGKNELVNKVPAILHKNLMNAIKQEEK